MSIIQSRHEDSVRLSDCISTSQTCSLPLKKPMQSQVQRGQKRTVKSRSSSAGARKSCLKSHLLFPAQTDAPCPNNSLPKRPGKPLAFRRPSRQTCWDWAPTHFTKKLIYDQIRWPKVKKAPNVCTFPSSHQSTLTVLARDGASRQERPNVLRHLASVQKNLR